MEFVIAGLFLIASSIILHKTRELSSSESNETKSYGFELFGSMGLGAFILFVGLYGLAVGIYSIQYGFKETFVLFGFALSANVQTRLLNYGSLSKENGAKLNSEKGNGLKVIKTAFSTDLFPKQGSGIFFIHACQLVQISAIALYVFSLVGG